MHVPDNRAFPGLCSAEYFEQLHIDGGQQVDLNSINMFANLNFDSL